MGMQCPLCEEGFSLRELNLPQLQKAEKRKAQNVVDVKAAAKRAKYSDRPPSKRLFVGGLPFVVDASTIREALGGGVDFIHWIPDRTTGLWYGSAFVQMESKNE